MKMPTSVGKITPFPYTGQRLALAQGWTFTNVMRLLLMGMALSHFCTLKESVQKHYFQKISQCVSFAGMGKACLVRGKRETSITQCPDLSEPVWCWCWQSSFHHSKHPLKLLQGNKWRCSRTWRYVPDPLLNYSAWNYWSQVNCAIAKTGYHGCWGRACFGVESHVSFSGSLLSCHCGWLPR